MDSNQEKSLRKHASFDSEKEHAPHFAQQHKSTCDNVISQPNNQAGGKPLLQAL